MNRQERLCITVVDLDAGEKTRNLRRKYPQLDKVCDIIPLQADLHSVGLLQNILASSVQRGLIQHVYVCLGEPVLSLQVCLNLLQIPEYVASPIWVRISKEAGLADLLEKPLPGLGDAHRVRTFDFFDYACSAGLILGGLHEMLARDLHESYRTDAEFASTRQSWEQLSEALKDANRQQASRIRRLLKETDYQIYPLQDWDAGKRTFSNTEIEKMACLEHHFWRRAKEADGWTFGRQRNEKSRTHPDLVPWDELPEGEREKNRAAVRQFPALLARIGFQVERMVDSGREMLNM